MSDGERGDSVGDNYDNERVFQIADVIEKLKATYKAKAVILTGHSGGAAIAAKLISLRPSITDRAFIVSCPCNINSWRSDMFKLNQYGGFKGDLDISSPIDLVSAVASETKISIYIGRNDNITKPYLSNQYHSALIKAGKISELLTIDGNHEIFQSEPVVQGVINSVNSYNNQIQPTQKARG
jgi:predicted esterase